MRKTIGTAILLLAASVPLTAHGADPAHRAERAAEKGVAFLREAQRENGAWSPKLGPAITGLAVAALLDRPGIGPDDPTVAEALDYIKGKARPDGGIHGGMLASYNTAICLSALSRVPDEPGVSSILEKGEAYLKGLQWSTGDEDPDGKTVTKSHPYYGGFGYGSSGRPDGSNTQFAVQALHDLGVSSEDPVFDRAVRFMNRLQGHESNDMFAEKIASDGGAIYATSLDKEHIGVPVSYASPDQVEAAEQGRPVSGLRTYGSMTYAMFKTYVYADLDADDPRVKHAREWIRRNYTLDKNPGMPSDRAKQGYYYYLVAFGRALSAWGKDAIETLDGKSRRWPAELIRELAALQEENGSWVNDSASRWMEDNPELVTAYALHALHAAREQLEAGGKK